jgi:hypothetical protein
MALTISKSVEEVDLILWRNVVRMADILLVYQKGDANQEHLRSDSSELKIFEIGNSKNRSELVQFFDFIIANYWRGRADDYVFVLDKSIDSRRIYEQLKRHRKLDGYCGEIAEEGGDFNISISQEDQKSLHDLLFDDLSGFDKSLLSINSRIVYFKSQAVTNRKISDYQVIRERLEKCRERNCDAFVIQNWCQIIRDTQQNWRRQL